MATEAPSTTPPLSKTQRVIQFTIPDEEALYAAYIPVFTEGGIFIPTTDDYELGDEVYVLLKFLDEPQRYPIVGTVVWITPPRASGSRRQGVGIRFPKDPRSEKLKADIERILGTQLSSGRPTATL